MPYNQRILFATFAVGLALTLAISLFSLTALPAALSSTLLSEANGLPRSGSSVNDQLGLRFTLSMNQSSLVSGQATVIQLDVRNTLYSNNTVNSAKHWKIQAEVAPCGNMGIGPPPLGLAIFRGYYTETNLWLANRLTLYGQGIYMCPLLLNEPSSYVFAPNSDYFTFAGSTVPMRLNDSFTGSWTSIPWIPSTETFRTFSPGVYTVVGGDEWGDLVVLHFVVSQ